MERRNSPTRLRLLAEAETDGDVLARVEGLSTGFESEVVLRDISFEIPRRGIVGIIGPAGVGKSTLLRTLARWNDYLPSFWARGSVWVGGRDLLHEVPLPDARRSFALLSQKARLYTATVLENVIADVHLDRPLRLSQKRELAREILAPLGLWRELESSLQDEVVSLPIAIQRKVSLARLVAGGAVCLLADEPLRDISAEEAESLGAFLRQLGETFAILMVTHNQPEARDYCDTVCLLSAGRIVETGRASDFFREPRTELGRKFLRYGNCWPSEPENLEATRRENDSWERGAGERIPRPGGFHWVLDGLLGGMQQPGLLRDLETDLKALRQLGCRNLVTLTEERLQSDMLERFAIDVTHFPITDMQAPDLSEARALCSRISEWIDAGTPTVLHCKAGLGRTGTVLACMLVFRGENAVRAIEQVRCINPYYIQSKEQLAFVDAFSRYLRGVPGAE